MSLNNDQLVTRRLDDLVAPDCHDERDGSIDLVLQPLLARIRYQVYCVENGFEDRKSYPDRIGAR